MEISGEFREEDMMMEDVSPHEGAGAMAVSGDRGQIGGLDITGIDGDVPIYHSPHQQQVSIILYPH